MLYWLVIRMHIYMLTTISAIHLSVVYYLSCCIEQEQ